MIFAIEIDGQAVGGIGIYPKADIQKKNAEIAYWLAESFWGKGIMTSVIKQMTDFAFKTYPVERIFCPTFWLKQSVS